jgi:hypothetical protein
MRPVKGWVRRSGRALCRRLSRVAGHQSPFQIARLVCRGCPGHLSWPGNAIRESRRHGSVSGVCGSAGVPRDGEGGAVDYWPELRGSSSGDLVAGPRMVGLDLMGRRLASPAMALDSCGPMQRVRLRRARQPRKVPRVRQADSKEENTGCSAMKKAVSKGSSGSRAARFSIRSRKPSQENGASWHQLNRFSRCFSGIFAVPLWVCSSGRIAWAAAFCTGARRGWAAAD